MSEEVGPQGTGVRLRSEGTPLLNYSDPLLYVRCAGKKDLWIKNLKLWGKWTWVLLQELRDERTSFSSASLGDTPKKLTNGEKRVAPYPPEDRLPKKGKGGTSPSYAAATRD